MGQYQLYKDYEEALTRKGTEIQNTLAQKQRKLEANAAAMQRKYENNGFRDTRRIGTGTAEHTAAGCRAAAAGSQAQQ